MTYLLFWNKVKYANIILFFMNYKSYSERLDYLLELIKKGNISSPKQIAQKFNCCDKTARNMVNTLREKGYDIEYCRIRAIYFVKNDSR